jgi:hypothetical protein
MHNRSRKEVLRWYRCKPGIWAETGLAGCFFLAFGLFLFGLAVAQANATGLIVSGLITVLSAFMLAVGFRAGIGVSAEGVLVRSLFGRRRWASWSEIERFAIVKPPGWKGGRAIAVMLVDRRPLIVDGCINGFETKRSRSRLPDLLRTLEDERMATQRVLNGVTEQNP